MMNASAAFLLNPPASPLGFTLPKVSSEDLDSFQRSLATRLGSDSPFLAEMGVAHFITVAVAAH